jgi:hypothetical protein
MEKLFFERRFTRHPTKNMKPNNTKDSSFFEKKSREDVKVPLKFFEFDSFDVIETQIFLDEWKEFFAFS